jgi:NADPH:quinone reductase-like Zn-dependent oxidoreductase
MATMIAARLHAYGSPMTLDRIEVPEPRPTDVLVEVKACGVVPNLARVVSNFFGSLTPGQQDDAAAAGDLWARSDRRRRQSR